MKRKIKNMKLNRPLTTPRLVAREKNLPSINWTPLATFVLTGLVSYLTYVLCSNIEIVDYCSNSVCHIFG